MPVETTKQQTNGHAHAFVAEQLVELYAPDEAGAWLYSRNRLLAGQRPADLIGKGDVDPVLQVVALLKDGAYA